MRRHALRAVLLSLALSPSVLAQERTVWKIGAFDNSSEELGPATGAAVVFVVPESRAVDWPGAQQAVVPADAGGGAGRTIRFDLPAAPRGVYQLRLGLIQKTARAPVVQVEVNGRRGWFYQPLETYREGNSEGAILPQYAIGTLAAEVPAEFLRAGRNEISLTALTDPLSTALPGGETTDYATLIYDALELLNDPGAAGAAGVTGAAATPTVFFKREGGRVSEVVSVLVRWRRLAPQGSVTLSLPGWTATQPLLSEREFGEQRLEFAVPEFAAGARARVTIRANGRDHAFDQTLNPARKWTVYMVPHEHLDVGYSDFQTKLAELHSRILNEALDMNREHPEFRFTLDG